MWVSWPQLLPVGANLQASMLSKTIETQEQQLNTVAVDPEMAQEFSLIVKTLPVKR